MCKGEGRSFHAEAQACAKSHGRRKCHWSKDRGECMVWDLNWQVSCGQTMLSKKAKFKCYAFSSRAVGNSFLFVQNSICMLKAYCIQDLCLYSWSGVLNLGCFLHSSTWECLEMFRDSFWLLQVMGWGRVWRGEKLNWYLVDRVWDAIKYPTMQKTSLTTENIQPKASTYQGWVTLD